MDNLVQKGSFLQLHHLEDGALVLIDKPADWTSFDVVNKLRHGIRHFLGVKKFKVGHAGTLDPLATGLLLVCLGKYTKKIETLTALNKSYTGTITFGAETPTYDTESQPSIYYPRIELNDEIIDKIKMKFSGEITQFPPMFSAVKVKGIPLYKLARKGKVIERKSRSVTISTIQLEKAGEADLEFDITCSKGTYIRSIAQDIGHFVDNGAYLKALRRTKVGHYSVENALDIPEFLDQLSRLKRESR